MRTVRRLVVLLCAATLGACGEDESSIVPSDEVATTASQQQQAPSSTLQEPYRDSGVAVWSVDPNDPPIRQSESFTAMVTRLGCNGGQTGEVLTPTIAVEAERIVVTFAVAPLPEGMYTCPGNDQVRVLVELEEPIGSRELLDGACLSGEAVSTSFCETGAVRWEP